MGRPPQHTLDPNRWQRIQTLFHATLERTAEERLEFLAAVCGDDAVLLREVQEMLDAHDDDPFDLEAALLAPPETADRRLGTRIGPHRLVSHLGHGGMGDVYLAERDDEHFDQRVAIKVLRPGLGGGDLRVRFRAERQILARLTHPHIAPLLDGGVTEDGHPYLVMRYVEGATLTDFCDRQSLGIEDRLRLFLQVCDAVRFAHQNLVVHRDLKPGNILVTATEDDDPGRVQLLDFGIAKLLDPGVLGLTVAATRSEMRVMTPEYAAPEQVRGEAITTGTDVYALGVVLYELLTGERPYQLGGLSASEIERRVCETVPVRPSTAATSRTSAEGRQRRLRGDLDNIVMKALRKEPKRRYASVEALADDVTRYLAGHPVTARPDTVGYRLSKFVRRNRLGVGAAALIATLVVAFGLVMAVQATRLADHARELEQERDRVRRQVETTSRVQGLVSELFRAFDPNEGVGDPGERLRETSRRIVEDLEGEGEIQAQLLDELVVIYANLGFYETSLETARESLDVRRRTFPAGDPAIARGRHRLGGALYRASRFGEAEIEVRSALETLRPALGDDHPEVADALNRLALVQRSLGRSRDAEATVREALAIYRRVHGERHAKTADALSNLASVLTRGGGAAQAEPLLRQVLDIRRRVLGSDHPDVAWTLVDLAANLLRRGQTDEAELMLNEALAIQTPRYGRDHPDTSRTLVLLARLHQRRGQTEPAEALFREVVEIRQRVLGDDHTATAASQVDLAKILIERGTFTEAEALLVDALAIHRQHHDPRGRRVRRDLEVLVELYETWGRPEAAADYQHLLEHSAPSRRG